MLDGVAYAESQGFSFLDSIVQHSSSSLCGGKRSDKLMLGRNFSVNIWF